MIQEHDKDVRNQEQEIVHDVEKKDSEKCQFDWNLVGTISVAIVSVIGIGISALDHGDFNIKLPKKS